MTYLPQFIVCVLCFALAVPSLPYTDCCCKRTSGADIECPNCTPQPARQSTQCCCNSLTHLESLPSVDACHNRLSRRCECKRQFTSTPLLQIAKRQTLRPSTTAALYLLHVDPAEFRRDVSTALNQPLSRAPPGKIRLHALDCRWLA